MNVRMCAITTVETPMTALPQAALISILDHARVNPDEFDDWLDTEHIPERLSVPGFARADRWVAADGGPTSLAFYDLDHIQVLSSPAYQAVVGANLSPWSRRVIGKSGRRRFDLELMSRSDKPVQQPCGGLLFIAMDVAPEAEEDFNAWYDEEHVPRLFSLEGVMSARRYRACADSQRYVATYHVTSPAVPDSDAWRAQTDSRWGDQVRPHTSNRYRLVCRRYASAHDQEARHD